MKGDANVFGEQLERMALESRRRQGSSHPTAQRLAGYHERTLDAAELDEIQEHLAVCPECTQELLGLAKFEEVVAAKAAAGAAGVPTATATAASWQTLRARLSPQLAIGQAPPEPKISEPRTAKTPSRSLWWIPTPRTAVALTAALFVCMIGLQLWIYFHRAQPAKDLILVQPSAFEVTRGSEDPRHPISLFLGDATAVLSLPVPARPAFAAYRIEIRTLRGELRLAVTPGLVPMASRTDVSASVEEMEPARLVSFGLPQGSLPAGDYRLRLVGRQGAREEILAEHRLRIRTP